jgi:hypothetical protein
MNLVGGKTIAQVAEYRSLRACGIEELAVHQTTATPSGGVLFARKQDRTNKDAAREQVLDLFGGDRWPKSLSILTMPGVDWKFERKLLGRREGNWYCKPAPHRTYLTAIENDRSIYHAAVLLMPGITHGNTSVTQVLEGTKFAERAVRNRWVQRYFFGNVDDLMRMHDAAHQYDAAWLDYTGPMSVDRLRAIKQFFNVGIRHTLVLTVLRARWNRETSEAIDRAGGHTVWLLRALPGYVLHDIEYQDGNGSPMAQVAVQKVGTSIEWL